MKEIQIGATCHETQIVTEAMLAKSVGSGDVAVYATPMMIALMEHTAAALLKNYLDKQETSVGTMIHTTHEAATPCGMEVKVTAEIIACEGRKVSFRITASDALSVIGTATHERVIVQKDKFEARAKAKLEQQCAQ